MSEPGDTRVDKGEGGEPKRIRVLIVDDSAVARDLLDRGLSRDPRIEVVGKASDVYAARDKIVFLKPDVMTLDVEMPKMDGIEFLRRLMPQVPIPTVVVSAVTTEGSRRALEALDAGALEVVGKPSATGTTALRDMIADLTEKVISAARADMSKLKIRGRSPRTEKKVGGPKTTLSHGRRLIAIGASTGGTAALHKIIEALPDTLPPVVIVQHMPPVFTRMFAESLDRTSAPHVVEAEDGMVLGSGMVAVAPGDRHLRIRFSQGSYVALLSDEPKVSGHRPSVDVLFHSAAREAESHGLGVLLTGMGRDGADGLLDLRNRGGRCIAQDEASSVVWGMPREAWLLGAAERLLPLDYIAQEIVSLAGKE